jgi:hypothetical protein
MRTLRRRDLAAGRVPPATIARWICAIALDAVWRFKRLPDAYYRD